MSHNGKLKVLVVDDEAPARRKILRLLKQEPDVQVLGEADGAETAVAAIEKHKPDVVFMDVQMPGTDGFGVVEALSAAPARSVPRIIFVTAHDQYALRAFEVHALDYLLKPFSEERFRAALARVRQEHAQANAGFASQLQTLMQELQRERGYSERILVQENGRARFVAAREIAWIEADGNYLVLHCGARTYTVRGTLDAMQDVLDPKDFVRINRSSVVRLDAIRELVPWFHGEYKVLLTDGAELRWSRRFVKQRPELLKGSKEVRK
jgi:two-component system, LytTR family, response regulator